MTTTPTKRRGPVMLLATKPRPVLMVATFVASLMLYLLLCGLWFGICVRYPMSKRLVKVGNTCCEPLWALWRGGPVWVREPLAVYHGWWLDVFMTRPPIPTYPLSIPEDETSDEPDADREQEALELETE